MITLTRPNMMELNDWASQVVQDLSSLGSFGRLIDDDWQGWAAQFTNSTRLGGNTPNPYLFTDWQDWAERFCGAVS